MQIEISQFRQFKYSIVLLSRSPLVILVTIVSQPSCNIFVVKNAFISRHQMAQLVFRVPSITSLRTFEKQYKVLALSYLGFCKKNNTDVR